MSKLKWITVILIVVFAMGTVLAGCGGNDASNKTSNNTPSNSGSNQPDKSEDEKQPDPVTITYSEWGTGDQLNLQNELLAAFMAEYPHITVKMEGKDWGTYWQSLTAAAAGGALPDVYKMSFAYVDNYADLGVMKPLDDLIAKYGFETSDIEDSVLAMHQHGGKQMSMPIDANVIMSYYNQSLFDNAATNPKLAAYPSLNPTWEEIKDLAIKMTLDENNNTPLDAGFDKSKIKQWGLSVNPSGQFDTLIEPALFSNGGRMINDDGTLALNTPEAKEVMDFFIDLTQQGINTSFSQVEALGGDAGSTLASGKVAMVIAGNWYASIFAGANIKYAITHVPSFGGGKTTTVVQPAGLALSATTKHEEAAFKLISWLAGPEGQKVKAKQGAGLPSNKQAKDAYVEASGSNSAIFFEAHQYGILSPYNKLKGELVFTLAQQLLQLPFDGKGDLEAAIKEVDQRLASFR